MVVTKKLGVVAVLVVSVAALATVGCSNSVTGPVAHRDVQSKASRDSTGGGTCLSGWIVVDGIAVCR